jgi:hypothetical protein
MNRPAIVIAALASFVLGIATIVLGQNLILSLPQMIKRSAGVPWYITWVMVWITVLCAVALGGFLLAATARRSNRH